MLQIQTSKTNTLTEALLIAETIFEFWRDSVGYYNLNNKENYYILTGFEAKKDR